MADPVATGAATSAEEKIRIVLDGLRGEQSITELCRRQGIAEGLYYSWSKEFLECPSSGKHPFGWTGARQHQDFAVEIGDRQDDPIELS